MTMAPLVIGKAPKIPRASSERPDPTIPASAVTSPARHSIDTLRTRPSTDRFSVRNAVAVVFARSAFGREQSAEVAPDHHGDQSRPGQLRHGGRADELAVLEHGDPVTKREDLLETVRNEEDRNAGVAKPPHPLEQELGLTARDDGGGLVQDEQLHLLNERPDDFDHLLVGNRQRTHLDARIDRDAEARHQLARVGARPSVVYEAEPRARFLPDEDVLRDREMPEKDELLVDDVDALAFCFSRRGPVDRASVEVDLAGVRCLGAGQYLDESGLAGAVFSDQAVNFAGADIEGHRVRAPARRETPWRFRAGSAWLSISRTAA